MRHLHCTHALLTKTLNFELIVDLLRVACTCTQQGQSGSKRAFKPHSSKTFGMSGCSWEPCLKAMEQALKILEPSQQEIRRMHLSSLADHLSHAGVPPEEEASLIEALDFCAQEEQRN